MNFPYFFQEGTGLCMCMPGLDARTKELTVSMERSRGILCVLEGSLDSRRCFVSTFVVTGEFRYLSRQIREPG